MRAFQIVTELVLLLKYARQFVNPKRTYGSFRPIFIDDACKSIHPSVIYTPGQVTSPSQGQHTEYQFKRY